MQTALNNYEYKFMHVHFLPSAFPLQISGPRTLQSHPFLSSCSLTSFGAYVMQRIERQIVYLNLQGKCRVTQKYAQTAGVQVDVSETKLFFIYWKM